jgi:hypothetical protein
VSGSTNESPAETAAPFHAVRRIDPLAFAPGLVLNGAAIVMAGFAIQRGSERDDDLSTIVPVAVGWAAVLLVWLFRIVAGSAEGTLAIRDTVRWLLAPAVFAAVAIAVFGGYALGARIALSAGALDAAADAALAGHPVQAGWIGLYEVESVVPFDGSVRIAVAGQLALVRDAPSDEPSAVVWYEPVFGRWSIEYDASAAFD